MISAEKNLASSNFLLISLFQKIPKYICLVWKHFTLLITFLFSKHLGLVTNQINYIFSVFVIGYTIHN